ncbi:hypothetical protein [Mesorhizobium huakuii]|uniref:Uncharacterized protein n=1 Tax=Mesorhizobium huakuii TaxID=28104 RepID=A0A7G6T462_9HYPH|nr:hypothetical protein [Mesorhizobium huakuii]QND61544.1 hypothetical protein HB778_35000 [Mesorhizobium huakuii]
MPIQVVCNNGVMEEADAVATLLAAHRQAVAIVERLGKRWMGAEGPDATLIGRRLDSVMAEEAIARRRAAAAPVADVVEMKMKAAYFQRLTAHGWCEIDVDDLRALLGSFTKLQS